MTEISTGFKFELLNYQRNGRIEPSSGIRWDDREADHRVFEHFS